MRIHSLLPVTAVISLVLSTSTANAAPPAFWHYYYPYSQPMETCGALIRETMNNIRRNWDLDGGDINATDASFVSGNTRGFLRCLKRGSNSSWVVIITAGGGNKARTMFNDMRVVVCGNC